MTHQPPHAITPLESLEQLDAAIARSAETPVLLFKHSTTCGTSAGPSATQTWGVCALD